METSVQDRAKSDLDTVRQGESSPAEPTDSGASDGNWSFKPLEDNTGKTRALLKRKKALVTSAMVLTLLGGGMWGASIISGPAQSIHFAKLLQLSHLQDDEDKGDARLSSIARYIREPSKPQNTRLGILGNALANRFEKRLKAGGIESSYTKIFGFMDGYILDPSKFPDSGRTEASRREYFKNRFGIDVETRATNSRVPAGRFFVPASQLGYFKQRALIRTMLESTGSRGIPGAMRTRIMGARAGIDWHPIRRLDDAILKTAEQRYLAWRERRAARVQNGAGTPAISTTSAADPEDEAAKNTASAVEEVTDNIIDEATEASERSAAGDDSNARRLEGNLKLKIAGGGVGLAGIVCLVHGLSSNYDSIKSSSVVDPLKRIGMEAITVGNQEMDGTGLDDPSALDQLKFFNDLLYDEKTGTSWSQAPSIEHNTNQTSSGLADPPEVRIDPEGNVLSQITRSIPGIDSICTVQNSVAVQGGLFLINFVGGPISAVLGGGAGLIVTHYIPDIIKWLVGQPIDEAVQGAQYGSYADWGAMYAANDAAAAAGGWPLTAEEVAENMQFTEQAERSEFQSKGIAHRLFNIDDPRSLLSRIIDKQSTDPSQTLASLGNNLFAVFRLAGSSVSQLLLAKTSADEPPKPYDYKVKIIGKSVAAMNDPTYANPFTNASEVINRILPSSAGQTYIERAKVCNGMSVNLDGTVVSTGQSPTQSAMEDPANKCAENNRDWRRIQFYIDDTTIIESVTCKGLEGEEGDPEACNNINFGSGV